MDRETWKLMFGDTPMPGDVSTPENTVQWSPNGVANLGPGVAAGENMAANPASWVQRGDIRVNNQTSEAQKLVNGQWTDLGYSPYTNEALQNSYGVMKSPDGTDPSQYRQWALDNGWKEPQRNAGMTLGEALLMMGGAAVGAGALNGLGGAGAAGQAAATTVANPGSIAAQWAALEGTPTLVMGGDLAAGGLGAFASEAGFGGLEAAATGLETGYGPNGDLTLEEFLTSPDSVTGLEGFGGSQGILAMDTLGSTSWLESAVNSLKHGDMTWLTSAVSPTQIKSVLSKAFGGGSAPTRTGATKTAAGAGGMGGINIFNTGGDESGLADAMKIFSGGRSGMDSVVQAMSQSGKGN